MANITFKLEGQLLTKTNEVIISSGNEGTDTASFSFDDTWDGYIKTAVFYQNKDAVQYAILDTSDTCVIPAMAMKNAGIMCVGVFGVKDKEMLTSTVERVEILEGSADSDMDLEPSDNVFIAIVSRYQEILEQIAESNESYSEIITKIDEQNAILETLNAFDVQEVDSRLSAMEIKVNYAESKVEEFEKNFRISNISIVFDQNGEFIYSDDRITSNTLCDVYFDALSVASASASIITVESCEGYLKFKTTFTNKDTLKCSVYCMGV